MTNGFTVRLADLSIGIESGSAYARSFFGDYLSNTQPDITVRAEKADIEREMEKAPAGAEYAELLHFYREMAERLPLYDRAVFHGAAIEYEGKAYLFTGPSGIGKSTHIRLWREYLGEEVRIINGDKPILRMDGSGITVYGTPYAGKEGWQRNVSAPLGGIGIMTDCGEGSPEALAPKSAFLRLYRQIYRPKSRAAMLKTLDILRALSGIPCHEIVRGMTEDAVRASFNALTGKEYGR